MEAINPPRTLYVRYGKRLLDLAIAVPLALLLSPLMLVVAIVVRWRLGAPVLFRQDRIGKDDRHFRLAKFRTMTDRRDASGALLPDGDRLTPLGLFLRKTSLDELPQLWNVLRGDMSLIGPRPLLVEYLPRYNARQRCRHKVMPGITGLAQVAGRNLLSWEVRFEHDVTYVREIGPALDCWILWRTLRGLSDTSATVPTGGKDVSTFMGSPGSHSEGEADAIETTRDARSLERTGAWG
jgi:undecaprenyl phosphate N,N'-diacetylbacillosamine 1-phosphate transferase